MKSFLVVLLMGSSAHAHSWTTKHPSQATIVAFDRACVELKDSVDGKKFKVKRESLEGFSIRSGTKIEYFNKNLKPHLCG